jgi:hypothetical protein
MIQKCYKIYNNDWRYGQQDMSPMWRPTWYKSTKQQLQLQRTTEHYLRNYIKINRLDYEQQLKLKERHLEQ